MRELPDGTILYTLDEAEGIEFETFDVYLHELVLMFFGLKPDEPVDVDGVQKGVYVMYNELKKKGYKVQDPHYVFISRKLYSFVVERVVDNLWWSGYLEYIGSGVLKLTEKGKRTAKRVTGKVIKERDHISRK